MPLASLQLLLISTLSFAAFFRSDEALQLQLQHITLCDSHVELFVPWRKNDQHRQGSVIIVAHGDTAASFHLFLHAFLTRRGFDLSTFRQPLRRTQPPPSSPLFGQLDGNALRRNPFHPPSLDTPLAYNQYRYYLLRALAHALEEPLSLVQKRFGTHSGWRHGHPAFTEAPQRRLSLTETEVS